MRLPTLNRVRFSVHRDISAWPQNFFIYIELANARGVAHGDYYFYPRGNVHFSGIKISCMLFHTINLTLCQIAYISGQEFWRDGVTNIQCFRFRILVGSWVRTTKKLVNLNANRVRSVLNLLRLRLRFLNHYISYSIVWRVTVAVAICYECVCGTHYTHRFAVTPLFPVLRPSGRVRSRSPRWVQPPQHIDSAAWRASQAFSRFPFHNNHHLCSNPRINKFKLYAWPNNSYFMASK